MSLCQALREAPSNEEVRALLRQTASHADTYEELAELYQELLIRLDGEEALSVSLELGRIYEEKLAEPDKAIEAFEKARIAEPPPGTQALTSLLRLYGAANDVERQLGVLEALTEVEKDDALRASRFFQIGQLCENNLEPPSPDKAARAYEEALALKPDFLEAAQALANLYESARRFDRLMEVLEMERPLLQGADLEKLVEHMADVATRYYKPLAVEVAPLGCFYSAEEYHQDYLTKNPSGYCHLSPELFELARRVKAHDH